MEEEKETVGGVRVYNVSTEVFNGPFDVLLDLIEKRKLFINDISLAEVADDFIRYTQHQKDFPLQESAHFVLIASTLILIKSRSLLPSLTLTEEEEEDIGRLEERLKAYREVKNEAERITESWGSVRMFFGTGEKLEIPISFQPDNSITAEGLFKVADEMLDELPPEFSIPKVKVEETVKLETVISSLMRRVSAEMKISFREFAGLDKNDHLNKKKERSLVIVSFIALLELVKQGVLTASQEEDRNDIRIENSESRVSGYI